MPAFTGNCLRFFCVFTQRREFDLCVSMSSTTMLAFENNVSCSSNACYTPAFCCRLHGREYTGVQPRRKAAIVRKRRVIHQKSTCVCLRHSVATRKREDARFDLWPALGTNDCPLFIEHYSVGDVVYRVLQKVLLAPHFHCPGPPLRVCCQIPHLVRATQVWNNGLD